MPRTFFFEKAAGASFKSALAVFLLALSFSACVTSGEESQSISDAELKSKIAQMLIIGFRGTEATSESYITTAVKAINPGGIILFDHDVASKSYPRNITGPAQTAKLISDLKKYFTTAPLIAVDLEGGRVNRLKAKYGFADFPSAQSLGEKNDPLETRTVSESIAVELSSLGINMNFAPVVDVNINPQNPVIGALGRSFSDSAEVVTAHAKAFIEGHLAHKVINSLKHFPGHGSSTADSHLGMADVTATYKDIELIPYKELIKAGLVDMIMSAHIMNRNIDPNYPATLSPKFLTDKLRGELEFNGVAVSDDMNIAAISSYYGFEDSLVLAINAGCDLLIVSNNGAAYDETLPYRALDAIYKAVKNGRIKLSSILISNERIKTLKKKYGIL